MSGKDTELHDLFKLLFQAHDKIIAVLEKDIAYGYIKDIGDCPAGLVDRLKHYFLSYKQFPGEAPRRVEIVDVYDREEAVEVISRSLRDYRKQLVIRERGWSNCGN